MAAAALAVTGCTSSSGSSARSAGPLVVPKGFQLASALAPFDACADYLAWVKQAAKQRVGPYGLQDGAVDLAMSSRDTAASLGGSVPPSTRTAQTSPVAVEDGANKSESPSGAAPSFSSTNVAEKGVDEPDSVKVDGKRMVLITDGTLHVLDVTGAAPVEIGSLRLEDSSSRGYQEGPGFAPERQTFGHQLLVSGDRVIVLSQGQRVSADAKTGASIPEREPVVPTAVLIEVSLVDPSRPNVVNRLDIDGSYVNARLVGGVARVVVRSQPDSLEFIYPSSPKSAEKARRLNQQVIDESTIEQWIPSYRLTPSGGKAREGQLLECSRINHPKDFAGFSTLSVLTIDLAKGLTPGDAVAVLGDGETVYASASNLYVGTNRTPEVRFDKDGNMQQVDPEAFATGYSTAVHQFDISGTGPAKYVASGSVAGHILNNFSLSEDAGLLRVASTKGTPWGRGPSSESVVTVLQRDGAELKSIGEVGNLGKGEQIYAVRFIGTVGYVVTFRQTDPLYTIDLSDPKKPVVRGELKILGFSAYLHPVGDGKLLGIGQDATEQGQAQGAQLSLFDVSDLANPTRVGQTTMPGGWTNAGQDYHAFLWWAPAQLAMLPMQQWDTSPTTRPSLNGGAGFNGAIGFTIGSRNVTERGRVSHPSSGKPCGPADICVPEAFRQPIERIVVIGNHILTVSAAGVMTSNIADLTKIAWLPFG